MHRLLFWKRHFQPSARPECPPNKAELPHSLRPVQILYDKRAQAAPSQEQLRRGGIFPPRRLLFENLDLSL